MTDRQVADLTLVVRHTGQGFPLTRAAITIGSQGENDIVVSDPQSSRQHAAIFWDSDRYWIQDLGSASGTYLNERQIVGPQPLEYDSVLRVGGTVFDLRLAPMRGEAVAVPYKELGLQPTAPAVPVPPATARRRSRFSAWSILLALLVTGLILGCSAIVFALLWPSVQRVTTAVVIQAPAQDALVAAGNEIVLRASASGAGDITRLDLMLDELLVASATSLEPQGQPALTVTQPWTFDQLGPQTLSAVAYTANGQVSAPALRSFTVVELGATPSRQTTATAPASRSPTSTREAVRTTATASQTATETASSTSTPSGPEPPSIAFFRARPDLIAAGECSRLEWGVVTSATTARINQGIGGVGTPDRRRVCPAETTTYTMTATGPGGTVSASTTVTVQ